MAISAALVKELRERTGAPMMDCKKALVSAEGDIDAAIEIMRKSGQAKADKKAGRVAAEGMLIAKLAGNHQQAILLEINSETDFVARDSNFVAFADAVAELALAKQCHAVEDLNSLILPMTGESVEVSRQALVSKVGENILLRRIAYVAVDQGTIGTYVHDGKIAAIVKVRGGDLVLAKDIAMHIVAAAPQVTSASDVAPDLIAKEREIFMANAAESGKPADIIAKMVEGRVKKFVQEISLTGQAFIKDPNVTVGELCNKAGAEIDSFVRFVLGEGIEKQQTDFVAEVMAQVQGS